MIDILIPTYNRAEFLRKNLLLLNRLINEGGLQSEFRIIVSDNCSTDNTPDVLEEVAQTLTVELQRYRQEQNIGLEPNVLFLLKWATSEYVMYVGDDDYLPRGYLEFVVDRTKSSNSFCVIPGYSELFPGDVINPRRNAAFDLKHYPAGFATVCELSNFGHQLSGLVTRRDGLYEVYTQHEQHRNLYPFVFFVAYCMLRGGTFYAPKYQVLVSQGNSKDWRYDASGLLIDIFKNYKLAFPHEPFKAALASIYFAKAQSWRLRVGRNPMNTIRAFFHLVGSKDVSLLIKVSMFALYPYCYVEKGLSFVRRHIPPGSST